MDAAFLNPVWIWLAIGAGLLAVEVSTGSGYLLWASAAAGVVAGVHAVGLDPGWAGDLVLFAVLAIAATFASKRLWPHKATSPPDPLNDSDARLVGREARVVSAFQHAHGRVFVDGKEWAADLVDGGPAPGDGGRVQVLGVIGGSRLRVRALS